MRKYQYFDFNLHDRKHSSDANNVKDFLTLFDFSFGRHRKLIKNFFVVFKLSKWSLELCPSFEQFLKRLYNTAWVSVAIAHLFKTSALGVMCWSNITLPQCLLTQKKLRNLSSISANIYYLQTTSSGFKFFLSQRAHSIVHSFSKTIKIPWKKKNTSVVHMSYDHSQRH